MEASPQGPGAVVERYRERFNAHDLDGLLGLYGAEVVLALNGDRHAGRDGVRGLFWMLFADFPDLHMEVDRSAGTAGTVTAEVRLRASRGRPARGWAGRHLEVPACVLFHLDEEGHLLEVALYFDGALLLRQMGRLPLAA